MSRILEALKHIDAHRPSLSAQPDEPVTDTVQPDETDTGIVQPDEPITNTVQPDEPVPGTMASAYQQEPMPAAPCQPHPPAELPPKAPSVNGEIRELLSGPGDECGAGIRELASRLLGSLPPGRSTVLLFTSPEDGAGKTAAVAPLAALLAQRMSGSVLAIDANLRRPQLAERLAVAAGKGLADVLDGAVSWQDAVCTLPEGLRVLPAGNPADGRDAAPDVTALGRLLDELRGRFRLVLLDAASLAHAEAAPLSRLCDGTCLVVRLGQTTQPAAKEAVRAIGAAGGRLLGCVVTGQRPA